jgi:prepilin peptidase CpaA
VSTHTIMLSAPLAAGLVWATVTDLRARRIPNWLTFAILLTGVAQSCTGYGTITLGQSLLGIIVAAAVPFVLFAIGATGGADVKLMAGIGAWLGPGPAVAILLVEKVVALLIVLAQAAWQGKLHALSRNSAVVAVNLVHLRELGVDHVSEAGQSARSIDRPLPYAVPVLVATVAVVAWFAMGGRP